MRSIKNAFSLCTAVVLGLSAYSQSLEGVTASIKALGMAQAESGYPQDSLCAAYNPAGIVNVGDRFDIAGYTGHFHGEGKATGNINPPANGTFKAFRRKDFYAGEFGITKGFCLCDYQVAVGFAVYQSAFIHPNYDVAIPLLGTGHLELNYTNYTFTPSVAIKLWDQLALGLGVNIQQVHFRVDGLQRQTIISSDPENLTNNGGDTRYGVGVTLGAQWDILDCLSVGVSWAPRTKVGKLKKYRGFLAEHGSLDVPQIVIGGLAWHITPEATLCFDVEWDNWSAVRTLNNKIQPALDRALGVGTGVPDPDYFLGEKKGIGFGWKDIIHYRVGLDYKLTCDLTLRVGYGHDDGPIPSSQTAANLLTMQVMQDYVTAGFTYSLNECSEISGFYAHGFKRTLKGTRDSIPEALGGGRVDLTNSVNAFGLSWGQYY